RKIKPPPRKVYLGEAQLWRGQAHMLSWRWRLGPARFGSYFGGASVSTVRAACPLSASAAVTAVTGYSSNSPLFFGRPICASRSRLGLSWSCRFTPVAPWQVLTRRVAVAGRGAYAIRVLLDSCGGIVSERLVRSARHSP